MPYDVIIERGKVREFARASKSTAASYEGPSPFVPPMFLTTAQAFWASQHEAVTYRDLGFDLRRLLHGEEEVEFFGPPPRAGMVLQATSRVERQWEKAGARGGTMRFGRIVTEFRDETGRVVAEQRTTLIETSRAPKQR